MEATSDYFSSLFSSTNPSTSLIDDVVNFVSLRVSSEMNKSINMQFTKAEVVRAITQMFPFKSPKPDVHLFPKCDESNDPEMVSHFRPISLCNVIYKIVSKSVANTIKPFISSIISETQSAFIPGRLIIDNILVAFELNHFLKSKTCGKKGFAAVKLDMSKAYDWIEWRFLENMLTSGQVINLEKSNMVLSKNLHIAFKELLASTLRVTLIDKHDKYLNLPAVKGQSKSKMFVDIQDKSHFSHARLRSRPSLTWRSIIGVRGLIVVWSHWRVGNGEDISIWKDKWIPREPDFTPIRLPQQTSFDLKVQSLIDPTRKEWRTDLVHAMFHPLDTKVVLSIPLGHNCSKDRLIWHFNSKGVFTVKSSHQHRMTDWNFIWKHSVPNKVKVFGGKACRNALVTLTNLVRRCVEVANPCSFCSQQIEDLQHILLNC
ncbi:UNVERIFIED_CONTAM: hypothetical protein Slati_2740300 [Sesamum latifolium]|uniref:Reverse transcriptase domain-containing protein n=1 Tax=Sesamum latifolium TaxID=2727402 RepID=A0AAW2VYV0_9LAMI